MMSNPTTAKKSYIHAILVAVAAVSVSAASVAQQRPPNIQVNPIPQARQLAAPAPAQPTPLSPRGKEVAERLRAATQTVRASAQAKAAAQAKEREQREEVHAAAKALAARVGASFKVRYRDRSGTPSIISGKPLHPASKGVLAGEDPDVTTAREFLRTNRKLFGLDDPDRELSVTKKQRDRLNRTQVRMEQSYKGVPVWPAELLIHLDAEGNVDRANGSPIRPPKHLLTTPAVVKDDAKRLAREALAAANDAETTDPEVIIYSSDEQPPRLAWKLEVSLGLAAHWLVVVDASTGSILSKFNQVMDASVPASGLDLFGVTRQVSAWEEDGVYYLIDANKPMFDGSQNPVQTFGTSGTIYVLDAQNTPADPDTQKPDSLYWVQSFDLTVFNLPDAVSAAYSLSQTYDYYLGQFGRNSLDGNGAPIVAVVRVGTNYPNAFMLDQRLHFGNAKRYAGALDVVAHELTHAVIRKEADLVYQGQSGALNEAFADIFGEMVEARTDGAPDWLQGSRLSTPSRNLADPSSFEIIPGGRMYPSRMSEFIQRDDAFLGNFVNGDNEGVHINSGIINRAYYLLAEGLPGAIGIADAEQTFYRALTAHLFRDAKFIDARHACIAAAEELFGANSVQAAKVAEAFDAVEIFDDTPTAPPTPFPEIDAPDSTLFVFWDADVGTYFLGRRETALGDAQLGSPLSAFDVSPSRPSVSADGSFAIFVDSIKDLCLISTDGSDPEEWCVGLPGTINSVAMSPQGDQFAIVFLDEFGEPDNRISIIDVENEQNTRDIVLRAPLIDGGGAVQVDSADAMAFSSSGQWLFYDAWNEIDIGDTLTFGTWSIYAIDLTTDLILPVVPPFEGLDFAYPALSKTSDNFLAFDAYDFVNGVSVLFTMNLFTGELTTVGAVNGDYGVPTFTGDDKAVVFSYPDATSTGLSLVRQEVNPNTMEPMGTPTVWLEDADFGVIYRRGAFQAPTETDNCPDDPNKTEPGMCGCGVPDTDRDGDGVPNCIDGCPDDPDKSEPGVCGCGVPDTDRNGDGVPNCIDGCPDDPDKSEPGVCGCGVPDTDRDGDGVLNCFDGCPGDPSKTEPGECGCGVPENTCATPAPSGTCGAGMGMIVWAFPVLGMLRFMPRRKRRGPTRGSLIG
jgi:Zn-dependent metalloprotease